MSLEDKARELAQAKASQDSIDWGDRQRRWLSEVCKVYEQVIAWLAPLQNEGVVKIQTARKTLSEENIGRYDVDILVLDFSGEAVVLEPIGTIIVGARGRIDIFRRGRPADPTMLLLSGSLDAPSWQLWPTSRDPARPCPFDEASFKDLLTSLL